MHRVTRRLFLSAGAAVTLAPALAQSSRPMNLVVPFPPGGSTDALARMLQASLQEKVGRSVIVENKPGAAGSVGAAQVAKSAPDGSTLLVTFDSHAVIPAILPQPPLDVEKDLVPVLLVGTAPYVLAAHAGRPFRNFADTVAASKANPGSVRYGSVGLGTIGHLAMTLLGKQAGVDLTHVPYRGGGPAMNDVIGGHVDLVCGSAALITPQLGGGQVRPILQMGKQRLPVLKDTQTAIEAGFADFEALAWWGVFAPKGTPDSAVNEMAQAIRAVLSQPAAAARLRDTQQMTLTLGGPQQLGEFFTRQVRVWGQVVRDNNIKAT